MKFYNRETVLNQLDTLDTRANKRGIMTVLTGRRRIGKTELALHFSQNKPRLYFFIGRKSEALLCMEFLSEIKLHFDIPVIGKIETFRDIIATLIHIAKTKK